ncbi:MAG: hypothetical protein ACE5JU_05950 [Candidatus Binatia bacterium]
MMTESVVEETTLSWFKELDYAVLPGPDIAPGELFAERAEYGDVVLLGRLRTALARINPKIPDDAREEAIRSLFSKKQDRGCLRRWRPTTSSTRSRKP